MELLLQANDPVVATYVLPLHFQITAEAFMRPIPCVITGGLVVWYVACRKIHLIKVWNEAVQAVPCMQVGRSERDLLSSSFFRLDGRPSKGFYGFQCPEAEHIRLKLITSDPKPQTTKPLDPLNPLNPLNPKPVNSKTLNP